jgi:hypothetical protein
MHASNANRLKQSFHDIADCAKIAGRDDERQNIFKLVRDWMYEDRNKWLLILDNLDDDEFLFETQTGSQSHAPNLANATRPILEYLPQCKRGSILITSRNKDTALKLVEQRNIIEVTAMKSEQALALLKTKLTGEQDGSDISELATALENMPLAIVQAAAYISQNAPFITIAMYLERFNKSERSRQSLVDCDVSQKQRRDWQSTHSTLTTWHISFEHLRHKRPSAVELLSLMSLFGRQDIPGFLLVIDTEQDHRSQSQNKCDNASSDNDNGIDTPDSEMEIDEDDACQSSMDVEEEAQFNMNIDDKEEKWRAISADDKFLGDIRALRNFCMVSVDRSEKVFEMHALVQLATRQWLEKEKRLEEWKLHFINNLCAAFPTGEYKNWPKCRKLFAHAKSALALRPTDEMALLKCASLFDNAAWYALQVGNFEDAIPLAAESMDIRDHLLGSEENDTLHSMQMLAQAYQ